jgi:hypothetical protein
VQRPNQTPQHRGPIRVGLLLALLTLALALPASASAFDVSRLRIRANAGYIGGDPPAFQLGAGVGYRILPVLETGLSLDARFPTENTAPKAWIFGPYATAFVPLPIIKPYAGLFYRHWFLSDFEFAGVSVSPDDLDSWGWRAGIVLGMLPKIGFTIGVVNERFFNCDSDINDCSTFYPELGASFTF